MTDERYSRHVFLKEIGAEGQSRIAASRVFVIGAGGAGLSSAVSAHQNGASVIVLEELGIIGGSTVFSGGAFNAADAEAARRYARLAGRCGLAQNPRALAAALNRLRAALKLPDRLSACGVEAGQLRGDMDALAEAALADLCTPTNPRSVSVLDVKAILKELV